VLYKRYSEEIRDKIFKGQILGYLELVLKWISQSTCINTDSYAEKERLVNLDEMLSYAFLVPFL
jgi:hypothetical protein